MLTAILVSKSMSRVTSCYQVLTLQFQTLILAASSKTNAQKVQASCWWQASSQDTTNSSFTRTSALQTWTVQTYLRLTWCSGWASVCSSWLNQWTSWEWCQLINWASSTPIKKAWLNKNLKLKKHSTLNTKLFPTTEHFVASTSTSCLHLLMNWWPLEALISVVASLLQYLASSVMRLSSSPQVIKTH